MGLRGINHVVLKVRSLEASDHFYREIVGLERVGERRGMRFYRAGGRHHDLALVEVGPHASSPSPEQTGLFHFCLDVSDEASLAGLHRRCREAGVPIHGSVDHIVMRSFFVTDPDGNVVELGVDVPREQWADQAAPFSKDRPYVLGGSGARG